MFPAAFISGLHDFMRHFHPLCSACTNLIDILIHLADLHLSYGVHGLCMCTQLPFFGHAILVTLWPNNVMKRKY